MNSVGLFFIGSSRSRSSASSSSSSSRTTARSGRKKEEEVVPTANNAVKKAKSTGSYGSKVKCPNTLAVREVGDIVKDIWDFIGPDETDIIMFQEGLITGVAVATIATPLVAAAVAIVVSKGDNISKLLIKAIGKGSKLIGGFSKSDLIKIASSRHGKNNTAVGRAFQKYASRDGTSFTGYMGGESIQKY